MAPKGRSIATTCRQVTLGKEEAATRTRKATKSCKGSQEKYGAWAAEVTQLGWQIPGNLDLEDSGA